MVAISVVVGVVVVVVSQLLQPLSSHAVSVCTFSPGQQPNSVSPHPSGSVGAAVGAATGFAVGARVGSGAGTVAGGAVGLTAVGATACGA